MAEEVAVVGHSAAATEAGSPRPGMMECRHRDLGDATLVKVQTRRGNTTARSETRKDPQATTYSPTPLPVQYHRRWRA